MPSALYILFASLRARARAHVRFGPRDASPRPSNARDHRLTLLMWRVNEWNAAPCLLLCSIFNYWSLSLFL